MRGTVTLRHFPWILREFGLRIALRCLTRLASPILPASAPRRWQEWTDEAHRRTDMTHQEQESALMDAVRAYRAATNERRAATDTLNDRGYGDEQALRRYLESIDAQHNAEDAARRILTQILDGK